jgi:hypothetical protein
MVSVSPTRRFGVRSYRLLPDGKATLLLSSQINAWQKDDMDYGFDATISAVGRG